MINSYEENAKNNDIIIKNNKVKSNPFAKKNKKVISFEDVKQDQKEQDNQQQMVPTLTQPQSKNSSSISSLLDSINTNGNVTNKLEERKDTKFNEKLDKLGESSGIGSSQLFGNSLNDEAVQKKLNSMGHLKGIDSNMLKDN